MERLRVLIVEEAERATIVAPQVIAALELAPEVLDCIGEERDVESSCGRVTPVNASTARPPTTHHG
jgi:hypothetical protein